MIARVTLVLNLLQRLNSLSYSSISINFQKSWGIDTTPVQHNSIALQADFLNKTWEEIYIYI